MKTLGIIPARYASTRFPGKPLADLNGKSLIQRVYERVAAAPALDDVMVATDDQRIYDHVLSFGGKVQMTSAEHQSGTDRCAEISRNFPDFEVVLNVQGDEPFLAYEQIERVANPLRRGLAQIATLAMPIADAADLFNPNVVKVVFNAQKLAMYFSRSTIPHLRGLPEADWLAQGCHYRHIGLYGYLRSTLLEIAPLPLADLERFEALEQLRWLYHGKSVYVELTDQAIIGVDTPEDLEKARTFLDT
ncbi:3-deoxy-manno-octulosonate cytidylyltransferase [Haliscomenobacter hydrossis]|uniref:3-deoxy-manno-octulosonate cytidylyltransferase n=1 Tax=Haliscomenobacter hydrossis (strain ATCC 27775 / DSM 1100 / LMG 10767 / O) TaxID=760192 RepID=F4L7G1_HALH1|nr:3-deoxy-manno-octulosonate cytidylyltransferase [Haliscomenobacter hydrossis]AEE54141.1 3-deoxy-manno-octulosonate cytidylyltransferase [Haliscomenobacter hydrossis DSM 1100]